MSNFQFSNPGQPLGQSTGFGFGLSATGTSFGSTTQPTNTAAGLTFGGGVATTTAPPSFNFGAATGLGGTLGSAGAGTLFTSTSVPTATTTASSIFGGFGAPAATSKPTFPFQSSFGTTATAPQNTAPGLIGSAFGATAPQTGLSSFGIGAPQISSTTFGAGSTLPGTSFGTAFGSSLGGTSQPQFQLGQMTAPSVTTQPTPKPVGLGGVDFSSADSKKYADKSSAKEALVPKEILDTVDAFKQYLQSQKKIREENDRMNFQSISKLEEDTVSLKKLLGSLADELRKNKIVVCQLKQSLFEEIQNGEMAHRVRDIPDSYDAMMLNEPIWGYMTRFLASVEARMELYKTHITDAEKCLASFSTSVNFHPSELLSVLKRLHEAFVALAGNLQAAHDRVEILKQSRVKPAPSGENFMNRDIFMPNKSGVSIGLGPSPFSGVNQSASFINVNTQPGPRPTAFQSTSSGFGVPAQGSSMFGSTGFGQSNASMNPSTSFGQYGGLGSSSVDGSFSLQKPPVGNKRNKR